MKKNDGKLAENAQKTRLSMNFNPKIKNPGAGTRVLRLKNPDRLPGSRVQSLYILTYSEQDTLYKLSLVDTQKSKKSCIYATF